jgi:hypothetical protein
MHELMRRTGSANPNQFAQWFDDATASWTCDESHEHGPDEKQITATKDQKKWYRITRGQQALSERALGQLARLFPDARQFFLEGPDQLWEALWGPVHRLWDVCACVAYDTPFVPNSDPDDGITVVGTTFAGPSLKFDESLYNFECGFFRLNECPLDDEIQLFDLSNSIAFYRLHQAVNALAQTDGVGAYRCVRMCMDARELWDQFVAFSTFSSFCVFEAINSELTEIEIRRLRNEPSYRKSVGIDVDDIEEYAKWPTTFCTNQQRMEILRIPPWSPFRPSQT